MTSNALFIGWNTPIVGKEKKALEQFRDFGSYLEKQKSMGHITGFRAVMLAPSGGHLNGFYLVEGEMSGISAMTQEETFLDQMARASAVLSGFATLPAYVGKELDARMQRYAKYV